VGAPGIGIIDKIPVERGDYVKPGQVLAYLKAEIERASVNVASAKAQAEADLKASTAARELAQVKAVRARHLADVGFISKEAVDQSEAEARIAENRVIQAQEAQRVSKHELELSNSQLAQRSIRAPFAGIVIDRYRTEGERVEREPIVRIAKVDPLRVEVVLPLSQYGQIELGSPVSIKTDITGTKLLTAKVVLIDKVIDAASNTFRVRLALPNPDRSIPAGLRCLADFGGTGKVMPAPTEKAAAATPTETPEGIIKAARVGRLSYQLQNPPKTQ
jgi:RND family efflux transporter MFP subunit